MLSFGKTLELLLLGRTPSATLRLCSFPADLLATSCRRVFRDVKYNAEPKPVRRAEGTVPRHKDVTGLGPERIERRTGRREEDRDCCTRVLRRSAGWRRTALETPDARPARKWKVGCVFLCDDRWTALVLPLDIAEWMAGLSMGWPS